MKKMFFLIKMDKWTKIQQNTYHTVVDVFNAVLNKNKLNKSFYSYTNETMNSHSYFLTMNPYYLSN